MEEHLIRAIKDAINRYFQIYIYDMEIIYKAMKNGELEQRTTKEMTVLFNKFNLPLTMEPEDWEQQLYNKMENCGLKEEFSKAIFYICAKELDKKRATEELQNILHMTKNYCAKLRLDGTDIYRPVRNEEYMEEGRKVYNKLIDVLEGLRVKNVLSILSDECQKMTP